MFALVKFHQQMWNIYRIEQENMSKEKNKNRTEPVVAGARDGWLGAITARTLFRECFRHLWALIDGENEDLTPISF